MGKSKGPKANKKAARQAEAVRSKGEDREKKRELKKKQNVGKRHGDEEERQYDLQMAGMGCCIKIMAADGNCLFRALADQVEGRPKQHLQYREKIMKYVETNREDFEPFMEEDEKFDDYIFRMKREKEWGGYHELYAFSRLFQYNVCVHQYRAPMFLIHCEGSKDWAHLSYHGEYHYNSVRALSDEGGEGDKPKPIVILDGGAGGREEEERKDENVVKESCPWASEKDIEEALTSCSGITDKAIEYLIASHNNETNDDDPSTNTSKDNPPSSEDEGAKEEGEGKGPAPKRVTRGAAECPCGSGKKYKKCCRKVDKNREKYGKQQKETPKANTSKEAALEVVEANLRAISI